MTTSADLRSEMASKIEADHKGKGLLLRPEIRDALLKVPREEFALGETRELAYKHNTAIVTKRRESGEAISSVSAAYLQAEMLGQAADALGTLSGCDLLEVGSGGYNAALAYELVGQSGSVTSVDIDPEVTDRASACLDAAGYGNVTVICADGNEVIEQGRLYDAIVVTAGAWDIPDAWRAQLRDGGVLVVPFRTWGLTKSWALRKNHDRLESVSNRQCGFVPVTGSAEHEIRYTDIADGVHIRLDEDQTADWASAGSLLKLPREEAWCGLSLPPRTNLSDLGMWLACQSLKEPGEFAMLTAQESAVKSGIVAPGWRYGTPAVLRNATFSYRSALRWTNDGPSRRFDLGAFAHGPHASEEAERMAAHMRHWIDESVPSPTLLVYPSNVPDDGLSPGTVLDKRHSRVVVSFNHAPQKEVTP